MVKMERSLMLTREIMGMRSKIMRAKNKGRSFEGEYVIALLPFSFKVRLLVFQSVYKVGVFKRRKCDCERRVMRRALN